MTDHPPIGVRQALLDAERDAYEAQVRTPNPRHREVCALMNPYTMTPHAHYIANLQLAEEVADMPGAIVECGCWRGGMMAGIAMLLGDERDYWLFDSFEGLPPAQPVDGERAAALDATALIRQYMVTSEQVAAQAMDLAGAHRYHIVKGWFEHTLPGRTFEDGIAFLRVDGDWHDSIYTSLEALFPQVNVGGIISVDDYDVFDGVAVAVHAYLAEHKRPERVEKLTQADAWQLPTGYGACFLRKRQP